MLLVMDVGNTSTVAGIYKGDELLNHWWLTTARERSSDEYGILVKGLLASSKIDSQNINAAIISSVVPPLTGALQRTIKKYFDVNPLTVGPGIKTGISIKFDYPREVGADRIVNAVAGYHDYGGPLIIVDFGTATTFCVISAEGDYLGGVIAPGINVSLEALYSGASKLPRVELEIPPAVIGKNTVSSMQSGILYGFVGLVKEIIQLINKESRTHHKVVATGEMAELIAAETPVIEQVDLLLTLKGLKIIYDRNKRA